MLLDDQSAAQGDHHEHAQHAAAQGDQADLHQTRHIAQAVLGPHEQGRQGEDGAGGHGLTGGADGLHHVIFQDGVAPQDLADDAHGNNSRGDGCGNGHAHAQSQVSVGAAKDDSQNSAQHNGNHGKFRHHLVRGDIGLEFFLFHDVSFPSFIFAASSIPLSGLRQDGGRSCS